MMSEDTIVVNYETDRVWVIFRGFVCWKDNSEKIVEIQRNLERENTKIIEIDFNKAVWIDSLMLCQLCLYLEKAKEEGKKIELDLIDNDDIEHIRFIRFLKDAGFASFMERIVPGMLSKINIYLQSMDMNCLQKGDFNSLEIVLPFRTIKKENEVDDIIDEATRMLNERNLGDNSISFRLKLFLQEAVGNVYEHAYEDNEIAYCGVFVVRKVRRVNQRTKIREYNSDLELGKKVNLEKYKSIIFNSNYYRIKKFNSVRVDYLQVYVVDIGKGILSGIHCDDPKKEVIILNQIFTSGKRINKRNKNTQAGGLYMLHNVLGVTADALGIKSDYNFVPVECERREFSTVKNNALYYQGYGQSEKIKGFSIVGYMNVIGDVTKEYRQFFRTPDRSKILDVYKEHSYVATDDRTQVVDYRFPNKDNTRIDENTKNIIILVERETSKNKLMKFFEECLCEREIESIVIGDFTDVEISKYYMIFSQMKVNAKKIILISRSYSVSVFSSYGSKGKRNMQYDQRKTDTYIRETSKSLFESVYTYIHWLINYESKLFWKFLNDYQNNSFQNIYIKGNLNWNYSSEKYMTTYLDFSQASFIKECRELFIIQLFRIISIYGTKIYFVSGDRFSEDICELANAELGTKDENRKISIGSAYVTGTSSLKQNVIQKQVDDDCFYFFKHADYEGEEQILALLNWEDKKELEQKGGITYERVEETPFIAKDGINFFRRRLYLVENEEIIKMSTRRMYDYFQTSDSWESKVCSIGHVDLVGPHDNIILNMVEMFKRDRLESYTQPKVLDTAYDFLLLNFYDALGRKQNLTLSNSIQEDFCAQLISSNATKEKVIEYSRQEKGFGKNEEGLLLHFTDYATTEIISFFQKIFSPTLNYRIIPIALMSRVRGAAILSLSPLLVDSLQNYFMRLKEQGYGKCRVTIFSAMIISTKLLDELKHVMFRIGAEEVRVLSLIDRQRLPFGYSAKEQIKTLWKLEVPPLGNTKNCSICNGRANLQRLYSQLGIESLCERISEVSESWKKKRAFDKKLSVIENRNIKIPKELEMTIKMQTNPYPNMKGIKITTDIGLTLFSIEDTTVTRSLKFLKECLKSELDDETKILLLCAHLELFKKGEISERKTYELARELYTYVKRQKESTHYSALAMIIIASQEKNIVEGLKHEAIKDIKNQSVYQNLDALICGLFICWTDEAEINANIEYYFKVSSRSLAEKLNAIFLYTCRQCITTHSGILNRIYDQGIVLQKADYKEAYNRIVYLKEIYNEFPVDILDTQSNGSEILNQVNEAICKVKEALDEYLGTENERLIPSINTCNRTFMQNAEQFNEILYKNKREDLQKELHNILVKIIKDQTDERVKATLQSIVIEWPEKNNEYEYWFFWTSDIIHEISYLMLDFRYLKQKFLYRMPDTYEEKEVAGVVEPIFQDRYLEIHFKNRIAEDALFEEIVERKKVKNNRPTILRIKELKKNMVNEEIFEFSVYKVNDNRMFDACLKIPYIYISKK